MSQEVDLNKLREKIKENQRNGCTVPKNEQDKIWVDNKGNIKLGGSIKPGEGQQLSEVHAGVFAATLPQRHVKDAKIVHQKMPANTQFFEVETVGGWLYTINSQLGDEYVLFAYYDGDAYQVKVVSPEVEKRFKSNIHAAHLFPDGRICFGDEHANGMATLEQAYAKSVLWATGFSILLANDLCIENQKIVFPFSINNEQD